jgi:nitrite reductase (NADH) large subunit
MMRPPSTHRPRLVIIGNGMAGARLAEDVIANDPNRHFDIVMFGDEPYGNYNRILLSNVLNGSQDAKEIFLNPLSWYGENGVTLHAGKRVTAIDRAAQTVSADGLTVPYDVLVFATGSRPFVPPIAGTSLHGVFVFRTIDDCRNIASYAKDCKTAVVIGGGLLGLEAAKGLMTHDVAVTVVEMGPWLMGVQLDADGGNVLRQTIDKLGIRAITSASTKEFFADEANRVKGVRFADGTEIETDMVVVSAGIRPNRELAQEFGIACDRAILVDDTLATNDPAVFAVGECAQHRGTVYGLVAPLWEQTKVLAKRLTGADREATYAGSKLATKLKVMGVELASMGRVSDVRPTDEVVQFAEPGRDVYWKAIVRDGRVSAACLLGDLAPADGLIESFMTERPVPARRLELFFPQAAPAADFSLADMPDSKQICDCNGVCKGTIVAAIKAGKTTVPGVGKATRAGTGCGSCKALVKGLIEAVNGAVQADPSESWYVPAIPLDKPTLLAEIKARGLKSVSAVLAAFAKTGDEKSKNGLASLLKGTWGKEYVDERDARYVNDRVHANIQNDGTFSVIPRMYGGVTSADDLIKIGQVAKKYDVRMVKVTGGQRIDLLGIKKDDLPGVWADLGMPSGYAYTKALRTVKTCVGSEFCRYGTNDSTGLGIALEKRYQGFEFPAKVKLGVSGCPRNCAESTVKDVGIVATEGGEWEVLVGGAAGAHVRKAETLGRVPSQAEAIRVVGRFLIYYRDNAKWLERTYDFVPRVGIERLRDVIVNDCLGLGESLDAEVERTAAAYVDPWLERNNPVYAGQFEDPKKVSLPVLTVSRRTAP